MWQRVLSVGAISFSLVCGFLPVGLAHAGESASERAEAARVKAERAEREAVEAEAQALREQQKTTAARLAELERELAEFNVKETERGLVLTLGDVQFAPDQETLTPETARKLSPLVTILKEQPKRHIRIEGHADSSGEESYNLDLSQRRADAVRDFLTSNGIDSTRITARGYGETEAVASNATKAGRRENRRVEVIVLGAGKRTAQQ